ncbi:MAG: cation:proton antiporter [Methanomassiliicoccaceae archaeon]|nr:cation:proton antiporter [Methanomassiliicoccaceae archaeon]
MDFHSILIMMVTLIVLAYIASAVFERFGLLGLIGEIVIGIVIANLAIGDWTLLGQLGIEMGDSMGGEPSQNYEIIELFAELGVIFLLFSIGLETKVKDLLSVGKAATLVAVMGVIIPFVAGFALIQIYDGNMHHALFMGAAMVATSVGITARVIKDMKKINAKESRIIIGAAVIDDILGMVVLAIVIGMASSEGGASNVALISIEALVFVLASMAAALWVVPKIYGFFEKRNKDKPASSRTSISRLVLAIMVCLGFSLIAYEIGLAAIIGAFLGGMLLAEYAHWWKLEERVESITALFISFFFLNVGMQVDLGSLTDVTVVALSIVVILLAIATKYIGCSVGAKMGDKTLSKGSRSIIGYGMVPRGEVGIIIAAIGLASGAMSSELYAVAIMMAVATTIIASPMLARAFKKEYPPEYDPTMEELV